MSSSQALPVDMMSDLADVGRLAAVLPAATKHLEMSGYCGRALDLVLLLLRVSMNSSKTSWRAVSTESWRHVYRPCANAVEQLDRMWCSVQFGP